MTTLTRSLVGIAAALAVAGAQAATLYSADLSGPAVASPGSISTSFMAGAGAGDVAFTLKGFASLDGDNFYVDIFHLSLNGTEIFTGTFDMGGGGTNRILLAPAGSTAAPTSFGSFAGGTTEIYVPLTLAAGMNTLTFTYESPGTFEGSGRAGPQGLGDEGWGLGMVTVTGSAVTAVPEPETYALMLAGLGAIGWLARRRRED